MKLDIKIKLQQHKKYFDEMFSKIDKNILLDEQQRIAILMDVDNLLVIAGAGSGKTTTMVGKVLYLIEKKGYKQKDICVLSFTKKVEQELKRIIHEKCGYKEVSVFTFHALGLDIIKKSGENYNKIVDDAGQYKIISNYIKDILFEDKDKFKIFYHAFSRKLRFEKEAFTFKYFKEYHDYEFSKELKNVGNYKLFNDIQIDKRKEYKRGITGEYFKSKEEVDIANFLFKNSISFEYELKFDKNIEENKWYYPDFYIRQNDNECYIEHFGIDQNGYNGMYTEEELKNYLKTYRLKQNFIKEKELYNVIIVTYSKYLNETTYLKELKKELLNKGFILNKKSDIEIYNQLKDTSAERYINRFINDIAIPFIYAFKQNGYDIDFFDELIENNTDDLKEQLIMMKDIYTYYEKELYENQNIDFEDMIHKAYYIIPKIKEKDLGVDYKYLIIDEYQDISKQRFNLINRLSKLFDAKIMAVGDDWQTIFGYSGSRIDIFENFEEELEEAESVFIEKTYRNSQELIDIAGDFIQKNTRQIKKYLISDKRLEKPVVICNYDVSNRLEANINRLEVISKILNWISIEKPNAKILLMSRYKSDKFKLDDSRYFQVMGSEKIVYKKKPKLNITFLTIHRAKGLGFDYCILLDLNDGVYGFPSKIEDVPIIQLIKPKIEEPIDYPEERRLFYVALTRTKNKVFLLVPKTKASSFAVEIMKNNYDNVKIINFTKREE